MVLEQGGIDLLQGFVAFVALTVRQDDVAGGDIQLSAGGFDGFDIQRGNGLVADDGSFVADVGL